MSHTTLPNTDDENKYTYHRHEEITAHLQEIVYKLPPSAPCRFLLSKGKNGKKKSLAPETVTIAPPEEQKDRPQLSKGDASLSSLSPSSPSPPLPSSSSDPSKERITIKYPGGSTYNLRKSYLLPILQSDRQIIVAPETDLYRRVCCVHTTNSDSFIEIGCDLGLNIGVVACKAKLGIDKSPTSLGTAKNNFPTLPLLEMDVLEEPREKMEQVLKKYSMRAEDVGGGLVVAIDINGNRELEAVVACLDRVLKWWQPRLVIVKARSLYSLLVEKGI